MTQCMVRPYVARTFRRSVGRAVLHQRIRPQLGACAPGHDGYQRACVLVSGPSRGPGAGALQEGEQLGFAAHDIFFFALSGAKTPAGVNRQGIDAATLRPALAIGRELCCVDAPPQQGRAIGRQHRQPPKKNRHRAATQSGSADRGLCRTTGPPR